jgi:uncharacterized membrane protein
MKNFSKKPTQKQEKKRLERLKLWAIILGILLTALKIALTLVALMGGFLGA